jgi:hypothetical protein
MCGRGLRHHHRPWRAASLCKCRRRSSPVLRLIRTREAAQFSEVSPMWRLGSIRSCNTRTISIKPGPIARQIALQIDVIDFGECPYFNGLYTGLDLHAQRFDLQCIPSKLFCVPHIGCVSGAESIKRRNCISCDRVSPATRPKFLTRFSDSSETLVCIFRRYRHRMVVRQLYFVKKISNKT